MTIGLPLISAINTQIINPLILLLISFGALVFVWGVAQTFLAAGDEEKRLEGYRHMWWGVIGLAIMIGVFGLINIILSTIGQFKV